jgi:hypothetical protein
VVTEVAAAHLNRCSQGLCPCLRRTARHLKLSLLWEIVGSHAGGEEDRELSPVSTRINLAKRGQADTLSVGTGGGTGLPPGTGGAPGISL